LIDDKEIDEIRRLLTGEVSDPTDFKRIVDVLLAKPEFQALADALGDGDDLEPPPDDFTARNRLLLRSQLGRLIPGPSMKTLLLGDAIETRVEWVDHRGRLQSLPVQVAWMGGGRFQLRADWPPGMTPLSLVRFIDLDLAQGRTGTICEYQPPVHLPTVQRAAGDQSAQIRRGAVWAAAAHTGASDQPRPAKPEKRDFAFRDPQTVVGKLPPGSDKDFIVAEVFSEDGSNRRPPQILALRKQGNQGVASFSWLQDTASDKPVQVKLRPLEQQDLSWLSIEQTRWLLAKAEFATWPLKQNEAAERELTSCGQDIRAETKDEGEWFVRLYLEEGAANA